LSSTGVNLRYDVFAVDDDGRLSRRPQRHMQDRPLFGDVDLVSTKHGVDSFLEAAFFSQLKKKLQRFIRDSILRVIKIDSRSLRGHTFATFRIVREQFAEM
jgi:hypothetical protein